MLIFKKKLTVVFVCHRTVNIGAVYQLKIKYDHDKFGVLMCGLHKVYSHIYVMTLFIYLSTSQVKHGLVSTANCVLVILFR